MSEAKKELVSGTIWNTIDRFSFMAIQLICTFIMGRFLLPEDFGIVGMLTVFTGIALTLQDSGFANALIREKNVTEKDLSTVFIFNVAMSIVLYLILYFASPFIATFFHQPILESVCKYTFLVIPLTALSLIQTTLCTKALKFKKLCLISVSSSLLASIISIIVAYYIRNVWALVLQNVLTFVFKNILLWFSTSWIPSADFSRESFWKYFNFSKNLLVSGLIGNIFNNIHSLLIGRCYTAADLGYYSQANRLSTAVSTSATSVVQTVSFPLLSKINNEGNDIKNGYKKIIDITVFIVGFILALLMGVSTDIFELLMGNPIWRVSGSYLFIMCIGFALYPLHSINLNILMVKGEGKLLLKLEILRRCIMILILLITVNFDIYVFVCGNLVYSVVVLFLNLYYCGKPIEYGVFQQIKDVLPTFIRLAIMVCFMLLASRFIPLENLYLKTIITIICGFGMGLFLFFRTTSFKECITIAKGLLKK